MNATATPQQPIELKETTTEDDKYQHDDSPSVLMRPDLTKVKKLFGEPENETVIEQWRAKYGDLEAFGDSPAEAMDTFDECWFAKLNEPSKAVS